MLLRLEDDDGAVGYGEAAPLTPYDGVTIDEVAEALTRRRRAPAAPGARGRGDGAARPEARRAGPPARRARRRAIAGEPDAGAGPPAEVAERAAQGVARRASRASR